MFIYSVDRFINMYASNLNRFIFLTTGFRYYACKRYKSENIIITCGLESSCVMISVCNTRCFLMIGRKFKDALLNYIQVKKFMQTQNRKCFQSQNMISISILISFSDI